MSRFLFLFTLVLLFFVACNFNAADKDGAGKSSSAKVPRTPEADSLIRKPDLPELFFASASPLDKQVDSFYNLMDADEKAAQLIMPATSEFKGIGMPYADILKLFMQRKIENLLFLKGKSKKFYQQTIQLDSVSRSNSILDNLYACDCEPTLLHKKFQDVDSLKQAIQLKTPAEVKETAVKIAAVMASLGMSLNFAPVVDISSNKEVINKRSFGSDTLDVILKSSDFVKTLQTNNIAATLKHFPGHGMVKGDSHKGSVYIDGPLVEMKNFEAVIKASSPLAVMVGHISIKNNPEYAGEDVPASISKRVITGLLKGKLNFKGLVVTDAMNMQAVKKFPDADWRALKAGADLIVMPKDPAALHDRIKRELANQTDLSHQLQQSIKKVIRLKLCFKHMRSIAAKGHGQ